MVAAAPVPSPRTSDLGQDGGQAIGQVGTGEMRSGDGEVVLEQTRLGCIEPRREPGHLAQWEPAEPERRELPRHGVGADGERSTPDRGLDGWIAEPLPRRRERDDVAGLVGVVDVEARAGLPQQDRAGRGRSQRLEHRAETVLGRTEQPEGGTELGRGSDAAGDVLPGNRAGGLEDEARLLCDTERGADRVSPRAAPQTFGDAHVDLGVDVEGVVDGRGGDAAGVELATAELVDGHVPPARVVGRWTEVARTARAARGGRGAGRGRVAPPALPRPVQRPPG